jgi:hypothetical protein
LEDLLFEDGDIAFFQNVGVSLQSYMASKPRRLGHVESSALYTLIKMCLTD